MNKRSKRRRRRLRKIALTVFLLGLTAGAAGTILWLDYQSRVYRQCIFEAGDEICAEDFQKDEGKKVFFSEDYARIDTAKLGDYTVQLQSGIFHYTCVATVRDTVPPKADPLVVYYETGEAITPEQFVTNIQDGTDVSITFVRDPDLSFAGKQPVEVLLKDAGENETIVSSYLISRVTLETLTAEAGTSFPDLSEFMIVWTDEAEFVTDTKAIDLSEPGDYEIEILVNGQVYPTILQVRDTTPPMIQGARDFKVFIGDTISYKSGVSVTDNASGDVSLKVDTSRVDLTKAGTYTVIYSAEDLSGNKTSVSVNVVVAERSFSQEAVEQLAREVLAQITDEEMTKLEILQAIYSWTRGSIAYTGSSVKDNWLKAAYEGFVNRKGDCYTYASVSKALLNEAGIANKDIMKIPTRTNHYWNLVNIGEGWYHFDATPRKGQTISFCYISDADLMAYSNSNNYTHRYDKTVYTDIE